MALLGATNSGCPLMNSASLAEDNVKQIQISQTFHMVPQCWDGCSDFIHGYCECCGQTTVSTMAGLHQENFTIYLVMVFHEQKRIVVDVTVKFDIGSAQTN
jgi:hypothetical protein